jgi:hypothetical protein
MEDGSDAAVRWSARVVLAIFFAAAFGKVAASRGQGRSLGGRLFRIAWPLGAIALVGHVLVAFALVHDWSHGRAYEHTAERTGRWIGRRIGWGVYWNYAMAAFWTLDAIWLALAPQSYRQRPQAVDAFLWTFFSFMVVSAAAVFEGGPTRWGTIAATAGLALFAYATWRDRALPGG